jgi:competence protein ComEC
LETSYQFRILDVIEGEVIDLERNEDYNKITVKQGLFRALIYDYNYHDIRIGDSIRAMGKPLSADPQRIESGFDYAKFLRHKKVVSTLMCDTLEITDSSFALGRIKTAFEDYLAHWFSGDSLVFMKAMLIGDDSGFTEEFSEAVTDNGILHLFAVSGLHIVLIVDMLNKIFRYFGFRQGIADAAICAFLFIFLILTDFSPSVLRAALAYYLSFLNRKAKLGFSPLDI